MFYIFFFKSYLYFFEFSFIFFLIFFFFLCFVYILFFSFLLLWVNVCVLSNWVKFMLYVVLVGGAKRIATSVKRPVATIKSVLKRLEIKGNMVRKIGSG